MLIIRKIGHIIYIKLSTGNIKANKKSFETNKSNDKYHKIRSKFFFFFGGGKHPRIYNL